MLRIVLYNKNHYVENNTQTKNIKKTCSKDNIDVMFMDDN